MAGGRVGTGFRIICAAGFLLLVACAPGKPTLALSAFSFDGYVAKAKLRLTNNAAEAICFDVTSLHNPNRLWGDYLTLTDLSGAKVPRRSPGYPVDDPPYRTDRWRLEPGRSVEFETDTNDYRGMLLSDIGSVTAGLPIFECDFPEQDWAWDVEAYNALRNRAPDLAAGVQLIASAPFRPPQRRWQ